MKRHTIVALTLSEFSAVRKPAMVPASIDITKADGEHVVLIKADAVPPPGPGPSDVHSDVPCPGCKKPMKKSAIYCSACGAPARKSDDPAPTENAPMTDQEKAEKAALEAKLTKMTKMSELTDVQKLHYGRLDSDGREAFLKMSASERAEECKPVHTAANGTVFTKADDPRLVEMSKQADADRASMQVKLDKADELVLEKRAETELQFLPGTPQERAALLKAAEGIKDEKVREGAVKALRAHNEKLGKNFGRQGAGAGVKPQLAGDPEKRLEDLVQKHYDESKDEEMTMEKAYSEVLESKEGGALYTEIENAKRASGPN